MPSNLSEHQVSAIQLDWIFAMLLWSILECSALVIMKRPRRKFELGLVIFDGILFGALAQCINPSAELIWGVLLGLFALILRGVKTIWWNPKRRDLYLKYGPGQDSRKSW
jgi:hypothetical protein